MPRPTAPIRCFSPGVLAALLDWPETEGSSRAARRRLTVWAATAPTLTGYATPGELVYEVRRNPHLLDPTLGSVAALADDPVATITVLSAVAPRLVGVSARYRRSGLSAVDVDTFDADLVAEAVAVLADRRTEPDPGSLDRLVAVAWERARRARRTERRRTERTEPFHDHHAGSRSVAPAGLVDGPFGLLAEGCRAGIIRRDAAVALARTALGIPTADQAAIAGCTVETLRARRSRAARRLALWAAA